MTSFSGEIIRNDVALFGISTACIKCETHIPRSNCSQPLAFVIFVQPTDNTKIAQIIKIIIYYTLPCVST